MTDRDASIDHAAEARKHLADVEAYENDAHSFRFNDEDGRAIQALSYAGLEAQRAKAHATLALVEQQRIANLIALFSLPMNDAEDMATLGVDYLDLAHQVKKGLGL